MKFVFKFFRLLEIILKTKNSPLSFISKSRSISSSLVLNNIQHHVPIINTIIDVGANQGQFALTAKLFFPSAKIISFEPVPKTFNILKQRVKKTTDIRLYNFALGNSGGEIIFHSNSYSHASSVLQVSDLQKQLMPNTAKDVIIKVEIKKLDDVITNENLINPILLKLDVQGFEKEVLKGAINTISKIDYLLFESSFVKMYDGEPLFDEMHLFVKELGFELIAPMGFLQSNKLQILQMDMLYRNISKTTLMTRQ